MKYVILALAAAFAAVSCENAGFLDQAPYSQTSPENFYKDESSMRMALISCYEIINGHKIPGASYVQRGSYSLGLLYIMNSPSDDMVAATSSSDEGLEMTWANYNESTRCVRDAWKVLYAGVNRCNTILHYINLVPVSESAKLQYTAEARFLRAFYYYHLAWNFGGIPIVTEFDSDGQEPRASLKDVYALILDDLRFAYQNLAEDGILQTSSANKYTAAAYLARICNYLAACKRSGTGAELVAEQPLNDFSFVDADAMSAEARDACNDVITHSKYILTSDYTNLFRETTKSEQYEECLLLAEQPLAGAEGYWPNSFYLPTPANGGSDSPNVYGGRFVPTARAFYMYHPKDPRRDHNFTGRLTDGKKKVMVNGYTYWNPDPPKSMVDMQVPVLDDNGNPVIDPVTNKPETVTEKRPHPLYDNIETQTYLPVSGMQMCPGKVRLCNTDEMQRSWQQHAFSYPLMRLADVYLMYAEALYFTGDEATARLQFEVVRSRAIPDPVERAEISAHYYRSDFVTELLESRERELIFEFSRKWDLIRFNLMDSMIESMNEDMVEEKLVDDPESPDYINPKYLNYDSGGYLKSGIPFIKHNWESHKIWLPISEEQRGVNRKLTQNAGWGI